MPSLAWTFSVGSVLLAASMRVDNDLNDTLAKEDSLKLEHLQLNSLPSDPLGFAITQLKAVNLPSKKVVYDEVYAQIRVSGGVLKQGLVSSTPHQYSLNPEWSSAKPEPKFDIGAAAYPYAEGAEVRVRFFQAGGSIDDSELAEASVRLPKQEVFEPWGLIRVEKYLAVDDDTETEVRPKLHLTVQISSTFKPAALNYLNTGEGVLYRGHTIKKVLQTFTKPDGKKVKTEITEEEAKVTQWTFRRDQQVKLTPDFSTEDLAHHAPAYVHYSLKGGSLPEGLSMGAHSGIIQGACKSAGAVEGLEARACTFGGCESFKFGVKCAS